MYGSGDWGDWHEEYEAAMKIAEGQNDLIRSLIPVLPKEVMAKIAIAYADYATAIQKIKGN